MSSTSSATVTPSLVMFGLPQPRSMTALRPRGPYVIFTARASFWTPDRIFSRASWSKVSCLAPMGILLVVSGGRLVGGPRVHARFTKLRARIGRGSDGFRGVQIIANRVPHGWKRRKALSAFSFRNCRPIAVGTRGAMLSDGLRDGLQGLTKCQA